MRPMKQEPFILRLNYWKKSWPLNPAICPCDVHFLEYLEEKNFKGRTIFHFGSGEHHIIGKKNFETGSPNEVLAITASRQEYEKYIDLIIDHPVVANYYKVMFADIYTLNARLLPCFDLVTLFHLCEFYDEKKSAYALLDDSSLLALFLSRLSAQGQILFYKGSDGFGRAQTIIERFVSENKIVRAGEYKTLLVYEKPS